MSVWFDNNTFLRVYPRTKLFVVIRTRKEGDSYKKHVIARGRAVFEGGRYAKLRLTRGEIPAKQLQLWLSMAGYGTKVVGAKRR